jgi:hypothetical protein
MRYLHSAIILPSGGIVKLRLSWRRPWEKKRRMRKRIDQTMAFIPPTDDIRVNTPEKAKSSILVNTSVSYRTIRITDEASGLAVYKTVEVYVSAGYLILDFDKLPASFDTWDHLCDAVKKEISRHETDSIIITTPSQKPKILVPVAHDLRGLRHGTPQERLLAIKGLIGTALFAVLDHSYSASTSMFMTRRSLDEFIWATGRPLRAVSMARLIRRGRSLSKGSLANNAIDHAAPVVSEGPSPHDTFQTGSITRRAADDRPTNHLFAGKEVELFRQCQTFAETALKDNPKKGRGRRAKQKNDYQRLLLAALIFCGGAATASDITKIATGLGEMAIPRRSVSWALLCLSRRGLVIPSSRFVCRLRSSGFCLTRDFLDRYIPSSFYHVNSRHIFPEDGHWNAYLFKTTGLFDCRQDYFAFVASIPGYEAKPERRLQAKAAWDAHVRRRDKRKKAPIFNKENGAINLEQ